jgi:hypothetical protein
MELLSYSTFDRNGFLHDQNNILFDIPLMKSEDASDDRWLVQGVASCEVVDADGEEVVQKGIDCAPLMARGYINWDHRDREGPAYLIGYPLEFRVVKAHDFARQLGKSVDGPALWVKGELYKNKPVARAVWEHIQATAGGPRQLGWSVQGRIVERDGVKKSRIVKSQLHHLAITHQPIQQLTFAEMVKSLTAGVMTTQSAAPTLLENLDGKVTRVLYGHCEKGCFNADGKFHKGLTGAMGHQIACLGKSVDEGKQDLMDAFRLMKGMKNSRFLR